MSGQLQHARFAVAQDSEQSDLRDSEIVARGGLGEDRLHTTMGAMAEQTVIDLRRSVILADDPRPGGAYPSWRR